MRSDDSGRWERTRPGFLFVFCVRQSSVRGCRFSFVFVYFIIKVIKRSPVPASFFPYLSTSLQWHCQYGTALYLATPRQTRELRKDLICGFQLGLQYHHAWPSFRQTDIALCAHLHLSVDHQLPDRQAAASEAGQTHIKNSHHQQWHSSELHSLPTALLPLHQWLHIKDPSDKLLKFPDDTTVIDLIKDGNELAYRQEVEQMTVWCSLYNLELNTLNTVEMIVDFRRKPPALPPLTIVGSTVAAVESFRFQGTTISQNLKWDNHIDSIAEAVLFNLPQGLLKQDYPAITESVLCSSLTVWFNLPKQTSEDYNGQSGLLRGLSVPSLQELYNSRVRKRAKKVPLNPSHPAHSLFELLLSGRRYSLLSTKTARHKKSFFPPGRIPPEQHIPHPSTVHL